MKEDNILESGERDVVSRQRAEGGTALSTLGIRGRSFQKEDARTERGLEAPGEEW